MTRASAPDQCGSKSFDFRLLGWSDGVLDVVGCSDRGRRLDDPAGSTGTDLRLVSPSASQSSLARSETLDADARPGGRDRIEPGNAVPPGARERPLDRGRRGAASPADDLSAPSTRSAWIPPAAPVPALMDPKVRYSEALGNLAVSMRRSAASRRHVLRQRRMLAPGQRRALRLAKERLDRRMMEQLRGWRLQEQDQERVQQRQQLSTTMLLNSGSLTNGLG